MHISDITSNRRLIVEIIKNAKEEWSEAYNAIPADYEEWGAPTPEIPTDFTVGLDYETENGEIIDAEIIFQFGLDFDIGTVFEESSEEALEIWNITEKGVSLLAEYIELDYGFTEENRKAEEETRRLEEEYMQN